MLDPSGVGKGEIVDLSQRQMNILTHMLGVGDHVPKKQWGYRNHYCARAGSPEEAELMELVGLDLVEKGAERLTSTYFHCTELGCKAAGLSKAAILRVFGA